MNALCLWLVVAVVVTQRHTTFALWPENPFEAVNYLLRYGYLEPDYSMQADPSRFLHYAVKNFQKKSMIKVTGEIDEPTMHQMQKKRCGVPDFSRQKMNKIFHTTEIRFVLNKRDATQAHWNKTDLTYNIKNYTPDLPKDQTDEIIKNALQVWADVSQLKFRQMNDQSADIVIEFVTWDHGDGVPFDGPGGTLAHAYFPETNQNPIEGDAHFDADETWTLENSKNGTNLFCTAVHEFGHSLGLSHTYDSNDIMFPYDTGCADFHLSENDVNAIQQLYGVPDNPVTMSTQVATETAELSTLEETKPPTTVITTTDTPTTADESTSLQTSTAETTTTTPIHPFPELCNGTIDGITYGADGNLYVFVDFLVFMFDANGAQQDYYTFISDVFPNGPNQIDAAFTLNLNDYGQNGHTSFTYLIRDPNVWKYYYHDGHDQFQLAIGYPKHKRKDFPNAPRFIRAAFYTNRKTYLIDSDYYVEYRYDCEGSKFETLTHTTTFRASQYFRNLPKDSSIDAISRSGDDYVNVFLQNDWYIIGPAGDIAEKFKTKSFFNCDVTTGPDQDQDAYFPDSDEYFPNQDWYPSHHGRHSPHRGRHSPHRGRHSPGRGRYSPGRGRHSPGRGRHSPGRGRHSPHRGRHSHKKHKKRRNRRHKSGNRRH